MAGCARPPGAPRSSRSTTTVPPAGNTPTSGSPTTGARGSPRGRPEEARAPPSEPINQAIRFPPARIDRGGPVGLYFPQVSRFVRVTGGDGHADQAESVAGTVRRRARDAGNQPPHLRLELAR